MLLIILNEEQLNKPWGQSVRRKLFHKTIITLSFFLVIDLPKSEILVTSAQIGHFVFDPLPGWLQVCVMSLSYVSSGTTHICTVIVMEIFVVKQVCYLYMGHWGYLYYYYYQVLNEENECKNQFTLIINAHESENSIMKWNFHHFVMIKVLVFFGKRKSRSSICVW